MKKHLGLVLACLIPFCQTAKSEEDSEYLNGSLMEETPAEIVGSAIKNEVLYKRDVVNAISRFDEDKRPKRERYSEHGLLEGFLTALEDELNEDKFFYAGREYDENDFVVKNQMLAAAWDALVANYAIFGYADDAVTKVKTATTFETPKKFSYRIKINPELDFNNYPRIRVRLKSQKGGLLNEVQFRFSRDQLEFGKEYSLKAIGRGATFGTSVEYDYGGEYTARLILKFPWALNE